MNTNLEINMAFVALKMYGTPYVWGGNDMTTGVDCSGFVCEVARSVGLLGKQDLTAQMLHDRFLNYKPGKNTILFFGEDTDSITHVAIAINEEYMIEAGGEGRIETDKGYVRIRPISSRIDCVAILEI